MFVKLTGWRFILFPPREEIGFEMFVHPDICPWAKRPLMLPVACFLTALGGFIFWKFLGVTPLTAALCMGWGIIVLRTLDLHVPPALAVALLPMVMTHPTLIYPFAVGLGTLLLTALVLPLRMDARRFRTEWSLAGLHTDIDRMKILPSRLLVRTIAAVALAAILAVPMPILIAPVLAMLAIVIALADADWLAAHREVAPTLERVIPVRIVKGRAATIIYKLSRTNGDATTVSILDELPADLGGDLLIEGIRVDRDQSLEIARERVPLRRGIRELGPIFVMWRSHRGFFRLRAEVSDGGRIEIVPPASAPQRRSGLTHRALRDELGIRPRPARGEGTEFESMREYVLGDDPRHVDWHVSCAARAPSSCGSIKPSGITR